MRDRMAPILANERARTIFYSVVVSALVCLAIVWVVEVQGDNSQADKSRTNCQKFQDGFVILTEIATDVSQEAQGQAVRRRWAGYAERFARVVPPQAATCEETFPKDNILFFIEP